MQIVLLANHWQYGHQWRLGASPGPRARGGGLIDFGRKERKNGPKNFDRYHFLAWLFIKGYWLACVLLLSLIPKDSVAKGYPMQKLLWYSVKDFEKHTQLLGKTLCAQGKLSYLKSVNAATMPQAFTRTEESSVIIGKKFSHQKPVPIMALHPDFWPSQNSKLINHIDHLSQF
ncbi:acyltransferase [Pseudozyma hubeiensis SY62]|uniref:Acyltransferase n=1 Tax=Pseudozyma hubeiensis (strain SY62) TaxID=1305764 RepID=R9PAA2_PSEHS|nr:acyltransferase [Pseudozyma hubeiensis SY62]GAC98274.1 acyltransferase [Pseudozyma hubeiensis SY62]